MTRAARVDLETGNPNAELLAHDPRRAAQARPQVENRHRRIEAEARDQI